MALKIKKSIRLPDGNVVEVEGTEAEIEAYEKKIEKKRQSEQVKKEKTILNGKDREDIRKIVEEELRKQPQQHHYHPVYPQQPRWDYYITQPKITWTAPNTVTGDKIFLGTQTTGVGDGFTGPVISTDPQPSGFENNWNSMTISGGHITVDKIASGSIATGNYCCSSVQ